MKIVTDSGTDSRSLNTDGFEIHELSLKVNIGEKTYLDGQGVDLNGFYTMMDQSEDLPKTSQPAVGGCDRRSACITPIITNGLKWQTNVNTRQLIL